GSRQQVPRILENQGAVGQPGQRVMLGGLSHPLFGLLGFGHIQLGANQLATARRSVADNNGIGFHPAVAPLPVAQAILEPVVFPGTLKKPLHGRQHWLPILRMEAADPFLPTRRQLLFAITQLSLPLWRVIAVFGFNRPFPETKFGDGNRQLKPPLRLMSRLLRTLALRDITRAKHAQNLLAALVQDGCATEAEIPGPVDVVSIPP